VSTNLNACKNHSSEQIFRVTHPFHPLFGQEFNVLSCRCFDDEDFLVFQGAEGRNNSISARWTSLKPPNPYIAISNGRSLFCPKDLLELVRLVKDLKTAKKRNRGRKAKV
jgi:hypothetical protein